jgi:AraC-like DNA-binding protein
VTPATFATQDLRPRDQLQAWQEWFAPVFDISPMEQTGDGFSAKNIVWSLGDISISRVLAPSVRVKRAKANLAKAPMDHWVLTYCRQGATKVQTPKGEFDAAGGVPFLWSFGEQFESKRTRVERTQIFMSRGAFHDLAPLLDAARGAPLEKPWGGLLGDYILAVGRWLPFTKESDAPRLTAAVRSMFAAFIFPSAEHKILAREKIDCGLSSVRRVIQAQLQSPHLRPAAVGRMLGISISQLYRLFERTGGVARYIQCQRLLRIGALLSGPANQRQIAAIAADFCFEDASSFSRAFRQEFGYSPSEVRSAATVGIQLITTRRNEMEAEVVRFADLFALSRD